MCRLIVWVKDNDDPEPVKNAQKFKPGMVVDILDDGVDPGSDIWKLGWWRVIDLPGVSRTQLTTLLGSDPEFNNGATFASRSTFPRKRVNALNSALVSVLRAAPASAPLTRTKANVDLATATVTALANPNVIGSDPLVIG